MPETTFAAFEAEARRLELLRGLARAPQYRVAGMLLRRYLEALGMAVSADRLEADIAWLAEQGLVTREKTEGVTVATLTVRGLDVSTGAALVPGVARPQPD